MDDEKDLVVFEDDAGNELTMEVLDYFFYEGDEYAMLVECEENCDKCEEESCDECEYQREPVIMKVVPVGEDQEEFVPVDDDLADKLIELIDSGAYDDAEDEDEPSDE